MNTLQVGDCLEKLNEVEPNSVDLIFADPPFNIGYKYDVYQDKHDRSKYLRWCWDWLDLLVKALEPTGAICIAIGDESVAEFKCQLDSMGLHMRNWIVWHYTFGVNCQKKFSRSHAHILYYVSDPKRFTFNDGPIRVPSARQATGDPRANAAGKLPDDTWVLRPQHEATCFAGSSDSWAVNRVCGTHEERLNHPCQMPEAILDRLIVALTNPGDLVLDPFAGSGTTLAAAKKRGRRYHGIELSPGYAAIIRERLDAIPEPLTLATG